MYATSKWIELEKSAKKQRRSTIDRQNLTFVNSEHFSCHNVFQRLMAVVQFIIIAISLVFPVF